MPVTVSIDIGTSIISLPLDDQALAYTVSYAPDFSKASIDIRNYTEEDLAASLSPAQVFQRLVREMPGVWTDTYSNLDSLQNMTGLPIKRKFLHIDLAYDEDRYAWKVVEDEAMNYIMGLWSGRLPDIPDVMLGLKNMSPKTKPKT